MYGDWIGVDVGVGLESVCVCIGGVAVWLGGG